MNLNLPASPIGDSKTRTSALFANQRTNLVQPRFAEVKAQPTVTRASVEVYRTTGGSFSHTKHLAPTPSYSMDIPRAKIGVDGIESGYVSAASIRKTLSGYAGSSDLQGKPRLRRLITLPRAQKNVYPKDAMGSETAAMGLECIAEDETEEFQVDVRTRSDKREPSVFTGNLGPAEDTADTSLSTRSARPATSSGVMRTALQTGQTADGTTGNTTGSWWVNSKRFSENSGTTISSGDTLDATVEYDAKGIIERRPSGRKSANSGTGTANLVYHHHSTSQLPAKAPIARPPRLSLSNVTRPSAIYEEYINVIPSPTKEDPPKLIPMVHGKANSIDKDLVMDPVVYKNTFFNARPAEEQARLKAQVLSSSTKPSGKTLHKSASEDTLDGSLNKPEGAPIGASRHVRFTDVRDIVTTSMDLIYESDHDERTELASVRRPSTQQASTIAANSSVASMQPRPSTAHSKLGTISNAKADISLPTAAGASVTAPAGAAAATTSTANISSKTSSNTLLPATAASTKATPNKQAVQPTADNGAAKQIDNLKQEIEALKRTVRNLQSHNDMLTELAMRDPLEDIPEDARLHIRTIELENAWLRKELSQLKHSTNA
ncbi:hypothetical protein GGI12_002505 [Dipsacomyces acuminosporus]|nr:hypothetical protein GGI12_002505 [Dipsacomyces acuminosporus]